MDQNVSNEEISKNENKKYTYLDSELVVLNF